MAISFGGNSSCAVDGRPSLDCREELVGIAFDSAQIKMSGFGDGIANGSGELSSLSQLKAIYINIVLV